MSSSQKLSNSPSSLVSKSQIPSFNNHKLINQSSFNKQMEICHPDHQLHRLSPKCHCQLFLQSGEKIYCSDPPKRPKIRREMMEVERAARILDILFQLLDCTESLKRRTNRKATSPSGAVATASRVALHSSSPWGFSAGPARRRATLTSTCTSRDSHQASSSHPSWPTPPSGSTPSFPKTQRAKAPAADRETEPRTSSDQWS